MNTDKKQSRKLKIEMSDKLAHVGNTFFSRCNEGAYVMVPHLQAAKMFDEISKHYKTFEVETMRNNTIFSVKNKLVVKV